MEKGKALRFLRHPLFLALICACMVLSGSAGKAQTASGSIHVKAWIDGSDYVYIQGGSVWYVHRNYQFPGLWGNEDAPLPTDINGVAWYPQWPDTNGYLHYNQRSLNTFEGLAPALPSSDVDLSLEIISARYGTSIVQTPMSSNGYTAVVLLDDDPPAGADWYEFRLNWIVKSIQVMIDIKPGSFPNSINLGSGGTVPVAVLSTPGFDAATVDPASVTLAGAPVQINGNGSPMASLEDVNGDGLMDLVVHVRTGALQLTARDTEAVLEGHLVTGEAIIGRDSVRIVPGQRHGSNRSAKP